MQFSSSLNWISQLKLDKYMHFQKIISKICCNTARLCIKLTQHHPPYTITQYHNISVLKQITPNLPNLPNRHYSTTDMYLDIYFIYLTPLLGMDVKLTSHSSCQAVKLTCQAVKQTSHYIETPTSESWWNLGKFGEIWA